MRNDLERFQDILAAIEKIEDKAITPKSFEHDEMQQVWVVHYLQIIGESASRISEKTRTQYPLIPWENMIGMRHILVHGYFSIDLDIVWSVVIKDLPKLKQQISKILDRPIT